MSDDVKRVYRSKKERMIAGICGGLAEYFHIDPTLVRLIFVVLLFFLFPPTMIIIYLILWLLIPQRPEEAKPAAEEVIDAEAKE